MDLFTFLLCKKKGGGGGGLTYTLSADTVNKQIVLTPSEGDAQAITVPYATDASTVNGKDVPELENGKIPATYLPSYVDDVLEYEDLAHFPAEGEVGKIYIALDTSLIYRWGGSVYAEINQSLALGETEATAYRGDRGKIAYDHSQSAHAPSNAEANQNAFSNITVGDTTIEADSKTDTLTLEAGSNITLTPDASTDKVTITATDTTYSDATTSVSGLMSGSDKTKLNGIATGAEVNQNTFSNVKIGSTTVAADSKTDTLELEAGDNIELTPDSTNDKITISGIPVTRTIRDVNIASFSDGGNAPIPSLTASIVPVQDFHGYDSPWAGGAGKNKFGIKEWLDTNEITYTQNGNSYTFNLDNNLYRNKWEFSDTDIATNFKATITIPSGSTASNVGFILYNQSGTAVTGRINEYSNKTGCKIGLDWSSLGQVIITEAIVTKSTDSVTPFAPYSNICPITGWTEEVITIADDTTSPTVEQTTTIPFTDSQGQSVEVFGGSVDVVNGTSGNEKTKEGVDLSSLTWEVRYTGEVNQTVSSSLPSEYLQRTPVFMAEQYVRNGYVGGVASLNNPDERPIGIWNYRGSSSTETSTTTTIYMVVPVNTTPQGKLVYDLATPTTFESTPTPIKSLDGENNVFASTGALREVTYRTQAYGDFIAERDLPDAISDIKTLKLDENQILIGDGSFDKIGLFMDNYYDENLDATFTTEVTPQEIYLTLQPTESLNQTTIISGDRTEYQTSLLGGTEVINTVNAIGMEVNVKENGSITHGIKIVSGDIRLLGSDTWDGTNISLKNALEAIQNNLYIANYNKTASLSSGSNTIALDMTGYTYNGSDIVNVYVDGLYKINNTDYTITVNDSTGVASINYTAAAAGTMAIQVIKPKIGFTALTDNNGNNVTDNNENSIDI